MTARQTDRQTDKCITLAHVFTSEGNKQTDAQTNILNYITPAPGARLEPITAFKCENNLFG